MEELEPRRGPGRPPNPRPETDLPPRRAARVPFGSLEKAKNWVIKPNHTPYWFSDLPGRVDEAKAAGYDHVKDRDGKNVVRVGSSNSPAGNGPLYQYLMEIPDEWYNEDMAAKHKLIDEKEATIKRGENDRKQGDGRYVPAQGISIKHGS